MSNDVPIWNVAYAFIYKQLFNIIIKNILKLLSGEHIQQIDLFISLALFKLVLCFGASLFLLNLSVMF